MNKIIQFFKLKKSDAIIIIGGLLFFFIIGAFSLYNIFREYNISKSQIELVGTVKSVKGNLYIFATLSIEYTFNGRKATNSVEIFPLFENYDTNALVPIKYSPRYGISTINQLYVRVMFPLTLLIFIILLMFGAGQLLRYRIQKMVIDGEIK